MTLARSYTKLEWLFYRIFLFTLRAQRDARTYTKLEWLFYRIFCSHSAHNVTLARIQNLNGFSIAFFCSHSAHNVTLARIHQLPTSVGLTQARPNHVIEILLYNGRTVGFVELLYACKIITSYYQEFIILVYWLLYRIPIVYFVILIKGRATALTWQHLS